MAPDNIAAAPVEEAAMTTENANLPAAMRPVSNDLPDAVRENKEADLSTVGVAEHQHDVPTSSAIVVGKTPVEMDVALKEKDFRQTTEIPVTNSKNESSAMEAGTSKGTINHDTENYCAPFEHNVDFLNLAEKHALSITDGSHLISEEGLDLWVKHFAPSTQEEASSFAAEIPVSWFNFILNLLLTPHKFGWTLHLLKSPLWLIWTENCTSEQTMTFIIPDTCSVSQAPVCKMNSPLGHDKENAGISPAAHSSSDAGSPLKRLSPSNIILLPAGEAISRKRRGKGPLVETQVRRSDRIREENKGFKRNSCTGKECLPCNAVPPVIQNKVVKNLTKSFCKVAEEELQEKLAKRPKSKEKE